MQVDRVDFDSTSHFAHLGTLESQLNRDSWWHSIHTYEESGQWTDGSLLLWNLTIYEKGNFLEAQGITATSLAYPSFRISKTSSSSKRPCKAWFLSDWVCRILASEGKRSERFPRRYRLDRPSVRPIMFILSPVIPCMLSHRSPKTKQERRYFESREGTQCWHFLCFHNIIDPLNGDERE